MIEIVLKHNSENYNINIIYHTYYITFNSNRTRWKDCITSILFNVDMYKITNYIKLLTINSF